MIEDGKVKYLNPDIHLIDLCIENEELDKYKTSTMQQLIEYKWDCYGKKHHLIGCIMHLFNTLVIISYVSLSYLREPD